MQPNTNKKINTKRLVILLVILLVIIGITIGLYFGLGLNKEFTQESIVKRLELLGNGIGVKWIFIGLNYLQTTILPISNIPTILAGNYLFKDPFETAMLTNVGVILGSITSFAFGKLFGKKAVYWIVEKDVVDHYLLLMKEKENYIFFLMLLLPAFPDDILCIIAGITSMSWLFFLIAILIARTIPNFMIAYFGDSIPFDNFWGILIWIGAFILFLLIGRLVIKHWDKIILLIERFDSKIKRHKSPTNSKDEKSQDKSKSK